MQFLAPEYRSLGAACFLINGIFALALALPFPAFATQDHLACDVVAQQASREFDVPASVLMAITRVETGRGKNGKTIPWPWTVNMEGKGVWFDTEDAARAYVFSHFKRGARSFDVGCFQINYKWHGGAFRSIDEMFNPLENARYAAKFLLKLKRELGNWTDAAGAYHSRTPEYASKYIDRFNQIYAQVGALDPTLSSNETTDTRRTAKPRVNSFPLFQTGQSNGLGSLFPAGLAGTSELYRDDNG